MPRVHLSEEELAARHPHILAPPKEPLHDVQRDDDDSVYVHGCKVAESIHVHRRQALRSGNLAARQPFVFLRFPLQLLAVPMAPLAISSGCLRCGDLGETLDPTLQLQDPAPLAALPEP